MYFKLHKQFSLLDPDKGIGLKIPDRKCSGLSFGDNSKKGPNG